MDPSVTNKDTRHKLVNFCEEHVSDNVPVISICETWLKPHVTDAQIYIENYQIIRQDRVKRDCGGVVLYIHNSLPVTSSHYFDDDTCEAVVCYVNSIKTIFISLYRPPDTPTHSFEKLLHFMQKHIKNICSNNHLDIHVMGDFNLPEMPWNHENSAQKSLSKSGQMLQNFIEENLLSQYVQEPTRKSNILDLFLTNNSNLVLQCKPIDTSLSDHRIVKIQTTHNINTKYGNPKPPFQPHTFRSLNFNKANYDQINDHLKTVNWDELKLQCSEEEFPELMRLTVLQICMLYTPLKIPGGHKRNAFVSARNILRRRKAKVRTQITAIKSKNPKSPKLIKLRAELYDLNYKLKESINTQRKQREDLAVERIKANPRYFYSFAREHNKLRSTVGPLLNDEGDLIHDPELMANMLQNQYSTVFSDPNSTKKCDPNINIELQSILDTISFTKEDIIKAINEISINAACGPNDIPATVLKNCKDSLASPIFLLWKDSLASGCVPQSFKNQIITPVYKKSSKSDPANYRPISLTSHVIKIFERLVKQAIVKHICYNNIMCPNQHGFTKHKSCFTQLLAHVEYAILNLLENADTDVIYLDYAKAFDKVDHQILLKKLHCYGIRGKLLAWITSYLSNREQTVVINGKASRPAKVISGVPQGTVLGPIFFILYLNDINSCIKHSIASSFADDTRLKRTINKVEDTKLLQEDLNNAITWSHKNNMVLHQDKFELLSHRVDPNHPLTELPFHPEYTDYVTNDGSIISPTHAVKDLGVTVTSDLSWSEHITNVTDSSRKIASWVYSVFSDRRAQVMIPLYKTLVRSRAEYNCPLWHPSKIEDIKKVESIQRAFTSRIQEVHHLPYWERLKRLDLMSLQRRRERYIIIHLYKIINNLAPNDIQINFHQNERLGLMCNVPSLSRTSKSKHQKLYDQSFHVTAAKLWNKIPKNIKEKPSLDSFKVALTKFLMSFPDQPPIHGVSSQNSLLDITTIKNAELSYSISRGGVDEDSYMARSTRN